MALIHPPLEIIAKYKVPPTDGEWLLLNFLFENLDSSYEVFFQPYLNGDRPDIILFREECGVLVIEVKDWNLGHYNINRDGKWVLRSNDQIIKSPIEQVERYKNNLMTMHIQNLFYDFIRNKKTYAVVSSCIFFSNAPQITVDTFVDKVKKAKENKREKIGSFKYLSTIASDTLNLEELGLLLQRTRLNRPGHLFKEKHVQELRRILKPPIHDVEDGIEIVYTPEQEKLTESKVDLKQKVKGVAGSGKTFVLAKKAVNAYKRTSSKVLIITYNIALKNYIHDRISDVREQFPWSEFHINNYHSWFKAESNNYGLEYDLSSWDNPSHFEPVEQSIVKYETILIDEAQDYKEPWLRNIIKYFLDENGELVVYGDEKQNIYNRKLDQEKTPIIPTIKGAWNRSLNTTLRFGSNILDLTKSFQEKFLKDKYDLDNSTAQQLTLPLDSTQIQYFYGAKDNFSNFYELINVIIEENSINDSDVCILSTNVEDLRSLDKRIRDVGIRETTNTTFETEEVNDLLLKKHSLNNV